MYRNVCKSVAEKSVKYLLISDEFSSFSPAPVISIKPVEAPKKPPPAKPPQPKRSSSSTQLRITSSTGSSMSQSTSSQSLTSQSKSNSPQKPEVMSRPSRQPPAKPSKPPNPQPGLEWIVNPKKGQFYIVIIHPFSDMVAKLSEAKKVHSKYII